ncbi:MAG TPA: response regulator [Alphaproteobacteria bacterium]|nr:response regulator [Alphaproteobacteria bacterium]
MACILLAEDDTSMRVFLARALERAGHTVVSAADGEKALRAIAEQAGFDLLIADIVMPGLDGIELARRATLAAPKLRVMFITGFAAVTLSGGQVAPRAAKVLSKPFHLRDLVQEVERLLAA